MNSVYHTQKIFFWRLDMYINMGNFLIKYHNEFGKSSKVTNGNVIRLKGSNYNAICQIPNEIITHKTNFIIKCEFRFHVMN